MQMPTRVLFVVANLLFCYLKSFLLFWEDTGGIQHSLPIRDNFLRKKMRIVTTCGKVYLSSCVLAFRGGLFTDVGYGAWSAGVIDAYQ